MDADQEVIHRCKKGDIDAFEELVRKYQKKMFNISYRMIGDYHDAAEVVQDGFLSAYRNIKYFKGTSKFSTWLYAIIVNLSRNRIKQMQARRFREDCSIDDTVETPGGHMKVEIASNNPTAQEGLEQHEIKQNVWGCINTLEPEFREVVVLRDIKGFSYDEISDMLKIAAGTVRSRLHRARLVIKECLKKILGDL